MKRKPPSSSSINYEQRCYS